MTKTKPNIPSLTPVESTYKHRTPTQDALRRLLHHRSAQAGMVILGILLLVAIFADVIAPYDPTAILKDEIRRDVPCIHLLGCDPAKNQHILGIDGNSRDLFSRVIFGSRLSLQVGVITMSFAILVGGLIGAIAGFVGGWLDNVLMRIMDVLMAFPSLLLAIAIVTVLGQGLINALLAIGIVSIPRFARLVRATPLIVQGTLGIATAILDAAALSFLGLGAEPPRPEWGLMLGEERNSVFNAPHLVFFPGFAIMLTVLGFNLLGDGLRDALDPRLRGGNVG